MDLDRFNVGDFEVHRLEDTIEGPTGTHQLQRKSMEVLVFLAHHAGEVVSRQALLDAVWRDRVVGDEVLNTCMSKLRAAFDDSHTDPRYFATVHGRGYKLIAPVVPVSDTPGRPSFALAQAGAAACIAAVIALVMWLKPAQDDVAPPPFDVTDEPVVLTFETPGDQVEIAPTVLEVLFEQMEQSRQLNIVPEDSIRRARLRLFDSDASNLTLDQGLNIAANQNAGALIHTSVQQDQRGFVVTSRVVNPATRQTEFEAQSVASSPMALIDSLNALSQRLRRQLGEEPAAVLADSLPPDTSIARVYSSIDFFAKARLARRRGELDVAASLCDEALRIDPESAAAHILRGRLHYGTHMERADAMASWQSALNLPERLSNRDRYHVRALLSYFGHPDEMRDAWRFLSRAFPMMVRAHYELGNVEWIYRNDFTAARDAYLGGLEVLPDDWVNTYHLGYVQLGLGRFEDAVGSFERAHERAGHYYNLGLGDALTASRRYDEALALYYPDGNRRETLRKPHKKLLTLYVDRGFTDRALREITLPEATRQPLTWGTLTLPISELAVRRSGQSDAEYTSALAVHLETLTNALASTPPDSDLVPFAELAILIKRAARAGELDRARSVYDFATAHPDYVNQSGTYEQLALAEAELARADGQSDVAVVLLEDLVARLNLYQAHESLANLYREQGNVDEAERHYGWLADHRGQAFAETGFSYGRRADNLVVWSESLAALGELRRDRGDAAGASEIWQSLLDHLSDADTEHALRRSVTAQLAALQTSIDANIP
ncbi:MAG: winged helix-turn-helix domain-containing protein [Pseudomonadota bacterium]